MSRLALGTAQWGMPYGIANATGPPPRDEIAAMLELARGAGVDTLDTARAYGESEAVIGALTEGDAHWRIATKLDPAVCAGEVGREAALARVDESLARSRRALRRERLDALLLHRAAQRRVFDGALWNHLRAARAKGTIRRLGISAATPEEALELLADPDVEILQVAASLLDQRLARAGFFARARARGVRVCVRSALLQGAAHLPVDGLPPALRALAPALERIDRWAAARGLRRAEAFLLYARDLLGVPVVVGCERAGQLRDNLDAWGRRDVAREELAALAARIEPLGAAVLDPSQWE